MTCHGKTLMTAPRTLTTLVVAIALALIGASTASAGQYRHLACPGTVADGSVGWQAVGNYHPSLHAWEDCGAGGWMRADITIADGYPVAGGTWAGWRYRAPANTRIDSFTASLAGWVMPFDNYKEGAIIVRNERDSGTQDLQWFEDRLGSNAILNDASKPLAIGYGGLATSAIAVTATCAAPSTDPAYWCNAWSPVWMAFKNAVVKLNDNQAPAAGTPTGTLVSENRLAGNKTIAVALTDQGGGVRQLVVKADGAEIARNQLAGGSCVPTQADSGQGAGYTAPVPCPTSVTANVTLDTPPIADGTVSPK